MTTSKHSKTGGVTDKVKRTRMNAQVEDTARHAVPRANKTEGRSSGIKVECESPDELKLWQAYIHVVKGNIGPGCLSMPYAFSQGGLITSLAVLSAFAPACIYCMLLLVWSKHKMLADGGARGLSARHINFEEVITEYRTYPDETSASER